MTRASWHLTAVRRLSDAVARSTPVKIRRGGSRGFVLYTQDEEVHSGAFSLGEHWVSRAIFRPNNSTPFPPNIYRALRKRARDLRRIGLGPSLACKLVKEHYYREG